MMYLQIFAKLPFAISAAFLLGTADARAEEAPSLGDQLRDLTEKLKSEIPESIREILEKNTTAIVESGILAKAAAVGDKAPDFALPNAVGEEVSLESLLKNGPVVLTFYRGGWCPYCNATLRAYQEALGEITKAGGQLVALTPELPDKSLSTKEKNDLEYQILSDVGQAVARTYGVVSTLSPEVAAMYQDFIDLRKFNGEAAAADELPLAATYVIDSSGAVRWAFIDADYRKRAEPADIVAALAGLDGADDVK